MIPTYPHYLDVFDIHILGMAQLSQVLDESLSFGVLGDKGLGLCEMAKVSPSKVRWPLDPSRAPQGSCAQVDAIMGSLELAVAGVGGFCAGRHLTAAFQPCPTQIMGPWSLAVIGGHWPHHRSLESLVGVIDHH